VSPTELLIRVMMACLTTREESAALAVRDAGFKFSRCAAAVFVAWGVE